MLSKSNNNFYVYIHKKLSDNQIFYVGKGSGSRYKEKHNRSIYWKRVVNKHGFTYEKIVANIDEELSFLVEQEKIDQLKKIGISLCNLTNGGEGTSGLKHSEETKRKMSVTTALFKHSEKTKKMMSDRLKGKPLPNIAIIKARETNKNRIVSDEFRQKMSKIHKGKKVSEETKKKMSEWQIGKKLSPETKAKIAESVKKFRALKKFTKEIKSI